MDLAERVKELEEKVAALAKGFPARMDVLEKKIAALTKRLIQRDEEFLTWIERTNEKIG